MKKITLIILVIIFASGLLFADAGLSNTDNKSSNLKLNLDADAYITGFSVSGSSLSHASEIELLESINSVNMTVSLVEKDFYFFYKAITDESGVKFQIEVTPMYQGGTAPTGNDVEKAKKTINYTATITPTDVWNGEPISGNISLNTTTSSTTSSKYLLKASGYDKYLTQGIARVVISSTEELGGKVPGNYTGTIKVTLSAS